MGLFGILKKKKNNKDDSKPIESNISNPIEFPKPIPIKSETPSPIPKNTTDIAPTASTLENDFPKPIPVKSETPSPEPEKTQAESKPITNNQLKETINKDIDKPKTEFDLEKTNNDNKYIDKSLNNNLKLAPIDNNEITKIDKKDQNIDTNLKELENDSTPKRINEQIIQPKEIHPDLKQKIDNHNESIHIEEETADIIEHNVLRKDPAEDNKISNKDLEEDILDLQEKYSLKSPNKKSNNDLELPDFGEEGEKIKHKNKDILLNRLRQRKEIKGDLFVKSTLFKEMLHSNLVIKEDIKICENKLDSIDKNIVAQSKEKEKLKLQLDNIQENVMLIDDKLFGNNPFTR